MRRRQVQLVVVCEDHNHDSFIRSYLTKKGYEPGKIRVPKYPSGRGCGRQFVRGRYVQEVRDARTYVRRNRSETYAIAVLMDQDPDLHDAYHDLDAALVDAGMPKRGPSEPFAVFAPRRNIETWVVYLLGTEPTADEITDYSAHRYAIRAPECRQAGDVFASYDPSQGCPLESLRNGCKERVRLPR